MQMDQLDYIQTEAQEHSADEDTALDNDPGGLEDEDDTEEQLDKEMDDDELEDELEEDDEEDDPVEGRHDELQR